MQHISEILPDFSKLGVRVPSKKRMLEIETKEGLNKPIVKINSSSVSLINTCKRKAFYALERGLRSELDSEAALFGKAIHAGLEGWYLNNHDDDKAIEDFKTESKPLLSLDENDKRHPKIGVAILKNYFKTYREDNLQIHKDTEGYFIERDFEFLLSDTDFAEIWYFGRIDQAMFDPGLGKVLIVDHKTTSSLGKEFFNRIKPNHQFTGYVLGAKTCFDLDVDTFMVNGIQVAKTEKAQRLTRHRVTYTKEDFDEFREAIEETVRAYLHCRETNRWAMTAPDPCAQWGGCQYRLACESPIQLRDQILNNQYNKKENDCA